MTLYAYEQQRPCIDAHGHKFIISEGHTICERCGRDVRQVRR